MKNPKIEIIPAILPKDFFEVEDKTALIIGSTKAVQVDICDGQFTHEPTWPYRKPDVHFDEIKSGEKGLPGWEKLDYEFDLMVNHPENVVEDWLTAGATRIIIHAEAKGDIMKAIELLEGKAEIGLALNIDTPLHAIAPYAHKIQFVQCMGIDHVGFQGQEFDDKVLGKVREVKATYPHLPISVDGGVSLDNAQALIDAGANRLVVGSAIFGSDNAIEAVRKFKGI